MRRGQRSSAHAFTGDFRRWKDHDAYKDGFERVLRDLTIES
jgi:hypothetical protein